MAAFNLIKGAVNFSHFYVVFDLGLLHNSDSFVFYFTLIILILLFQNNFAIENILTFRSHHTNFAHQMMGYIFSFKNLRLVDNFRWLLLFLAICLFASTNHWFYLKLLGKFNLQMAIAAFRGIHFTFKIIFHVFIYFWGVNNFDSLLWEIKILFILTTHDVITFTLAELLRRDVIRDYLIHFFEVYLCQKWTLHTLTIIY